MENENIMTRQQIAGNKLIAEFLGFEKVRIGYFDDSSETKFQKENEDYLEKIELEEVGTFMLNRATDKFYLWSEVDYHKSFDRLMPVFYKIEDIVELSPSISSFCEIWIDGSEETKITGDGKTWIESAWVAAVEFIKYYNINIKK